MKIRTRVLLQLVVIYHMLRLAMEHFIAWQKGTYCSDCDSYDVIVSPLRARSFPEGDLSASELVIEYVCDITCQRCGRTHESIELCLKNSAYDIA
jgi:hypothetical protein